MLKYLVRAPEFVAGQVLAYWSKEHLLTTACIEGQGRLIVANGQLEYPVMSHDGWHFNDPRMRWYNPAERKWEIIPNDPAQPDGYYDVRPWMFRKFGLHWVGLPGQHEVFDYEFSWTELELGEGADKGSLVPKPRPKERTKKFYVVGFPYVMVEKEAKTKDNLPVKVTYLLTLRITNPVIALTKSGNWLQKAEGYANEVVRSYIGEFTWDQLISETDEEDSKKREKENFSRRLRALNYGLLGEGDDLHVFPYFPPMPGPGEPPLLLSKLPGIVGKIGVEIESAELLAISLTGEAAAEHQRLTLIETTAARMAKAKRYAVDIDLYEKAMNAGVDALRIIKTKTAEAEGARKRIEAYAENPELAIALLKYDAAAVPGRTILFDIGDVGKKVAGLINAQNQGD